MQNDIISHGIIIKINGPVLDVRFEENEPEINHLLVTDDGVHMEVAAHSAPGVVRCIALESTDGLCCGTHVTGTGPVSYTHLDVYKRQG